MSRHARIVRLFGFSTLLSLLVIGVASAAQSSDMCAQMTRIPTAECLALQAVYQSLNGEHWARADGWLDTTDPCQWSGVECRDGHVVALLLRDNRLAGTLPAAIGNLPALEFLELANNAISGELPAEIGQLTQLRGLSVRQNRFSGALPETLGNLQRLEWLYVSQNDFDGALPTTLTALSRLETFYFRETELCEPLQPDFHAWLTGIPSLGRSEIPCNCDLITEIPQTECRALFALYAKTRGQDWNRQSGWLRTLTPCAWEHVRCADGHVDALALSRNNLRGDLPPELGHLTALTVLDLSANQVTGPIPATLGGLTALTHLNLSQNALEGPLPDEISQLRNLTIFDVRDNRLEGRIPASLGHLRALTSLILARNRFSGRLPATFGQLQALTTLDVSHNPLYGPLPPTLANLGNLQALDLSNTALRGTLPLALSTLPQLRTVRVDQSQLCVPEHTGLQRWIAHIDISGGVSGTCPLPYTGLLPALLLIVAGGVILLPGGYRACVSVFGESFAPPERLRGYYRKHGAPREGAPREGLPIQLVMTGLMALSSEFLWGVCTQFARNSMGYGFGVGLMLYLGYIIVGRRLRRRTRITWIGRILGVLVCGFLASFLLLTLDIPYATSQLLSLVACMALIMIPVWLMTSGVSTGGYWELMAEGLCLGSVWGLLAGGILGDALGAHAPLVYGGMADILSYGVFSQTLAETTRRFWANQLTGIFLFSLVGTGAGALARSLQTPVTRLSLPIHAWLTNILRPLLRALQKTA